MTPKQIVIAFQSGIETGNPEPTRHIHPGRCRQHSLQAGDGLDAILALHGQLSSEGVRAWPLRAIQGGALVAVHVDYDLWRPEAGFDVHRFEDGRIVGHWDNLQPAPSVPNPSGRRMLDGTTDNGDPARTAESKALVETLVREVAIARRPDGVSRPFRDDALIHRHPTLPDGTDALLSHLGCSSSAGGSPHHDRWCSVP